MYLATMINSQNNYEFQTDQHFRASPSGLGNVYRCHLDFIRLSKIIRT